MLICRWVIEMPDKPSENHSSGLGVVKRKDMSVRYETRHFSCMCKKKNSIINLTHFCVLFFFRSYNIITSPYFYALFDSFVCELTLGYFFVSVVLVTV